MLSTLSRAPAFISFARNSTGALSFPRPQNRFSSFFSRAPGQIGQRAHKRLPKITNSLKIRLARPFSPASGHTRFVCPTDSLVSRILRVFAAKQLTSTRTCARGRHSRRHPLPLKDKQRYAHSGCANVLGLFAFVTQKQSLCTSLAHCSVRIFQLRNFD